MYSPLSNPIFASIAPVTAIDLTINNFLGISWSILLPYTIFGITLMAYSHIMLMRGQKALKQEEEL